MTGTTVPPAGVFRLSEWLDLADWRLMMTLPDLAPLFLGVLALLFAWLIFRVHRNRTKQEARWEEKRRQQDIAKCQAIEEDLRAWLRMLRLPEFEDQKKLEVAARQLRIVLVERLMSGPRIR